MELTLVSPRSINLFSDSQACLSTIDGLRWKRGHHCPRCGSTNVKDASSPSRQYNYYCADCGYTYNTLAGTIFMGVRMPLPSYLQAFTIIDALGETIRSKDISFAIAAADGSVSGVVSRIKSVSPGIRFTAIDPDLSSALRRGELSSDALANHNFFAFCDMRSILIDKVAFYRFLEAVSTTPVPSLVEAYGRRGRPQRSAERRRHE
jgi:transposase-like protein